MPCAAADRLAVMDPRGAHLAQLAAAQPDPKDPSPEQARAAGQWATMMLVLSLLAITAIVVIAILVRTHRRHLSRGTNPTDRSGSGAEPPVDPWVEAGRRALPAEVDEAPTGEIGPDEQEDKDEGDGA